MARAQPPPTVGGAGRAGRWLAMNLILPVAAAWLLVAAFQLLPPPGPPAHAERPYGPLSLRLALPARAGPDPEPLLVCGVPGRAALVYLRPSGPGRARVGVAFLGDITREGDDFALPAPGAGLSVTCSLPALFPPEGDPAWAGAPRSRQVRARHEYWVRVDGILRLEGAVDYDQPGRPPLFFGANPLGGSLVAGHFSGQVLYAPAAR